MTTKLPRDAETIDATPALPGPPVDPPRTAATFADLMSRQDERRPIVPASLRSRTGRHALLVLALAAVTHGLAWQASRLPKYLGLAAWWAPVGAWKAMYRSVRWASATDGAGHLKQVAANRDDAETWLRLDTQQRKKAEPRWRILGLCVIAVTAGAAATWFLAPTWALVVAVIGLFFLFAHLGHPVDKPILEHAFNPNRYIRLTAELTRAALMATDTRIKDPAAIRFSREIYRDGPGYTAELALPTGVVATDIIDRRDYLAAGFQLPIAQVWPETVRDAHPGVLAVWVADRPVDRMKQPASPLLTCGPLDFWGQIPYGTDVRMRDVQWRLAGRNSLFGGVPATGKTWAARNVALGAAMDPLVRFVVSELKGSGDLDPLEPLCLPGMYASGADEGSKRQTMEILHWLDRECERRGPLVRKLAAKGLNTENSLNRAMADADPSLFPLVAMCDEIQELVTDPQHGKEAKALLTSLVKRGRFVAIHLILATQRIDKESVPRGVSSNISNRLCLGVTSHVETDLVLGTGAYARGARPTAFVPPADGDNPWAGWGHLAGRPQPVRATPNDNPAAAAIVQRALILRGEVEDPSPERIVMHNLLDDVRTVWPLGDEALWLERVLPRLVEFRPEVYGGWTKDQLGEALRRAGIQTVPLNRRIGDTGKRATRVGMERRALDEAVEAAGTRRGIATAPTK